jgi:hypothetical protein
MVGALDNFGNELIIDLGKYEKEFTNPYSIQYDMDRNFIVDINQTLYKLSSMEWIYKKIWELKSKALTIENKERIQKLQQLLDGENASETVDKNNSANSNSSKDSSIKKEEEEIHKFLYNRYNR